MSAETKYREGLEALERGNKACVSPRSLDAKAFCWPWLRKQCALPRWFADAAG